MTKHTPGPWLARPEVQREDWEPFTNGGCVDIGAKKIYGMTCADAKLIAAAPALLKVLEDIRDNAGGMTGGVLWGTQAISDYAADIINQLNTWST